MTKRTFVTTILAALIILAAPQLAHAAPAAPTIAVVDVEKILSESKAAKSLQSQIQTKRDAFQKEFSAKDAGLKKSQTELIEGKAKLSAEDFNTKRKAFESQVTDVKSLFEKRRNSLQQGVDKSTQELRKDIMEAAAKVASAKGYDVVLTRDSVLIAEKELDITTDVLAALDAQVTDLKLKVE